MDLNDKIKLIKLFISKGCNVNNKNIYGRSIINNAILFPYFSIDIFKLLLIAGCEYDKNNKIYIEKYKKDIELYLNNKQYLNDFYNFHIEKSSLLFSKMVLLSDDYLKLKEI